jgi:hypothetical protein
VRLLRSTHPLTQRNRTQHDSTRQTEVLQKVLQFYAGGVLMRAKGYDRPDNKCE